MESVVTTYEVYAREFASPAVASHRPGVATNGRATIARLHHDTRKLKLENGVLANTQTRATRRGGLAKKTGSAGSMLEA